MHTVNIDEAKSDLTRLVDRASRGETFIIAREGKPVVEVRKYEPRPAPAREARRVGFLKGRICVPDDFDTMGEDAILEMFEG